MKPSPIAVKPSETVPREFAPAAGSSKGSANPSLGATGIPVTRKTLGSLIAGKTGTPAPSGLGLALKVGVTAAKAGLKILEKVPWKEALAKSAAGAVASIPAGMAISETLDGLGVPEGSVENTLGTAVANTALAAAAGSAKTGALTGTFGAVEGAFGSGLLASSVGAALPVLAVGAAALIGPAIEHIPAAITGRTASDYLAEDLARAGV